MVRNGNLPLDEAFETLLAVAREHEALASEFPRSLEDFFQGALPEVLDPVRAMLDARRHQEWFLFERTSPALGGVPSEHLIGDWRQAAAHLPGVSRLEESLLESRAGIFEVRQVDPEGRCWVEDLGGLTEHTLVPREGAPPMEVGDLLVGRVYPDGEGALLASPAAGVFRSPDLKEAVTQDLAARRASGGPALLRFGQEALERAFYSTPQEGERTDGAEDPVATVREFLSSAGLPAPEIADILSKLRSAPLDAARWATGSKDALGEILDQLAFHTEVDLTQARAMLTGAWHALRRDVEVRQEQPRDVKSALAAFDEGRAQGRDVQSLLDDLERDLGLEDEPGEADADTLAPIGGAMSAIITEFRWECQVTEPDGLELIESFGVAFEQPEELNGDALRHLLCFSCMEQRAAPEQVARLMTSLEAFVPWADREQDLELGPAWAELAEARDSILRVLQVNAKAGPPSGETGELLEVLEPEDPRGLPGVLVSEPGGVPVRVQLQPEAFRAVEAGDLLRGELRGDQLRVCTAYPGLARRRQGS